MPRFHHALPADPRAPFELSEAVARHVQVLRLQPGDALTLFDGQGGEHSATVLEMGRRHVSVRVLSHSPVEREARVQVELVVGLMANERMDWLVEKATELGVAAITPLLCERSVLRLSGERAQKKVAHWQAVAVAACEQSGRNRVPTVHAIQTVAQWAKAPQAGEVVRQVLSLSTAAAPLRALAGEGLRVQLLSGPEGGLSAAEELQVVGLGFSQVSLGPRTLRAETAPLAALSMWVLK